MRVVIALTILSLSVACMGSRDYVSSGGDDIFGGAFVSASALLRGDVGELRGIDNGANYLFVSKEASGIYYSGTVPHQSRSASTVYLDIVIVNENELGIGQQLRQDSMKDAWAAEPGDGPVLDVYVCPNGEGASGNADDIVVTRTGPESFTFTAKSSAPEQNLDIDLDLATNP